MLREYLSPSNFKFQRNFSTYAGLSKIADDVELSVFSLSGNFEDLCFCDKDKKLDLIDGLNKDKTLIDVSKLEILDEEHSVSGIHKESFAKLSIDEIDKIIHLQEITFDKLKKEGTEKFLYKKTMEEYEKLLTDKDSFIIGFFKNDFLIGQLVVKKLEPIEEEIGKDYYIPFAKKVLLGISGNIDRFSIGGMIVHPDYRGNGLAQKLIFEAENFLKKMIYPKKICVSAISSSENPGSYLSFMSCGYAMISKFVSQEDGDTDYLLYKPLFLSNDLEADIQDSKTSSKKIQDLDNLGEKECIFRDRNKTFYVKNLSLLSINSRKNIFDGRLL